MRSHVVLQKHAEPGLLQDICLYTGIITGEPAALAPLLLDLALLRRKPFVKKLVVVILQNGASAAELRQLVASVREQGLKIALVTEEQQRRDAERGAFGDRRTREAGLVGIARARTMLQRYLGELMLESDDAFGWILDDDMRLDARAGDYLPWLPSFRVAGVDVLIGALEGSSPNPPLHGLRVQLGDLLHNLKWLQSLPSGDRLPDRSPHNRALREELPDYYYDLSRKHTGHLYAIFWIVPAFDGETVADARERLTSNALGLLSGMPLTRPILIDLPQDPMTRAEDSVNRGGNTFVINPRALSDTPNLAMRIGGEDSRRSDMVWAILNRFYRRLVIKRVDFPVLHAGRASNEPMLDVEKVTSEIIGAAFYAALGDLLADSDHHRLDFTSHEIDAVCRGVTQYADFRLRALSISLEKSRDLARLLAQQSKHGELDTLLHPLHSWLDHGSIAAINARVRAVRSDDVGTFLISLKQKTDDYARASVSVGFIREQLGVTSS